MKILDHKANSVSENKQTTRIAKTALVWLDVYLVPPFPPRLFDLVDVQLKLQKRIFEECTNRKLPKAKTPVEKLYVEQLRKADKQVVESYPIFERRHALVKQAKRLLYDISEKPTEANILKMEQVMMNLAQNFQQLSRWCKQRAKSWPAFVDSVELKKEFEEKKKSFLARFGPEAVFELLMGLVSEIASGGNVPISLAIPIIAKFGISGFKTVMSFGWQTRMLWKQAYVYEKLGKRVDRFMRVYEMPLKKGFLR